MATTVSGESSFCSFIYPFVFDVLDEAEFVVRGEAFARAKIELRARSANIWEPQPLRTRDVLKSVCDYIEPTPVAEAAGAPARSFRMTNDVLQSAAGLGANERWFLDPSRKSADGTAVELAFKLTEVRLLLFPTGVGLLVLAARPLSPDLDAWQDFIHYMRFATRPNVRMRAERRAGIDPQSGEPLHAAFLPSFVRAEGSTWELGQLISGILSTGSNKAWWNEIFIPGQLFPFASLFVHTDGTAGNAFCGELLYELRNGFRSGQADTPALGQTSENHESLLPYAERQWFYYSLDGGGFLAVDPPNTPFFRTTLASHLDDQYQLSLLLALHQRFALLRMSSTVATQWRRADAQGKTAAFQRIRQEQLDFTARASFPQVMQREHHHRFYEKWMRVFQIDRLHSDIDREIRSMHEYLLVQEASDQADGQRRVENRINMFAPIAALPGVALAAMAVQIHGWTSASDGIEPTTFAAILLASLFLAFAVGRALTRSRR